MTTKYDAIIQNFIRYSKAYEDFRAAAIIGSRARREKPAGKFSDLSKKVAKKLDIQYPQKAENFVRKK